MVEPQEALLSSGGTGEENRSLGRGWTEFPGDLSIKFPTLIQPSSFSVLEGGVSPGWVIFQGTDWALFSRARNLEV